MKRANFTLAACLRVWKNWFSAKSNAPCENPVEMNHDDAPDFGVASNPIFKDSQSFYDSIESGKRAQAVVYQTLWLQELLHRLILHEQGAAATSDTVTTLPGSGYEDLEDRTRMLISLLHGTVKSFALEFSELTRRIPGLEALSISTTNVRDVKERKGVKEYGMVQRGATSKNEGRTISYIRCRVSSPSWSLSIRGHQGRIEFFLVPASELFLLSESETPGRLKSVLKLNERIGTGIWTIDGLPADPDEMFYLMRSLFRKLVFASAQGSKEEMDSANVLLNLQGEALRSTVRELLLAEQNMAQKIVSQQEEIQNRIARDLHDAVISDLMMLKRSLSGDKAMSTPEIIDVLDQTAKKLREICHDLTPRDLRDWGLQTVVEDMLERLAERTGADCSLECDGELPELPYPVQLHLYRIIQESLNNMEKYAQATRIIVKFEVSAQKLVLYLKDNGKGFSPGEGESRKAKEGGSGLSGINERTEMIRCFYPTKLKVQSEPGKGSTTMLEIRLGES